MKNKTKEELMKDLTQLEQTKNKTIITSVYIFSTISIIFYLGIILLASQTLEEGYILSAIVCISTILLIIIAFYNLRLEVQNGYYECSKCHHRFVPSSYLKAMISPHLNMSRYLRCPECDKYSWTKKVMTKEDNYDN